MSALSGPWRQKWENNRMNLNGKGVESNYQDSCNALWLSLASECLVQALAPEIGK